MAAAIWSVTGQVATASGNSGASAISAVSAVGGRYGGRDRLGRDSRAGAGSGILVATSPRIQADFNVTAITGTGPSIQFIVETHRGDGNWVQVWASALLTATGAIQKKLGPGLDQSLLDAALRVRWVVAGIGPSVTFNGSLTPI